MALHDALMKLVGYFECDLDLTWVGFAVLRTSRVERSSRETPSLTISATERSGMDTRGGIDSV